MKTQTEALKRYLDDCDKHAIVPDIAGAFHFAWQEALAQPEQEPVAWYIREKDTATTDDSWIHEHPEMVEPLYLHPQPAQKQLTRDDLWKLWCNAKAESEYLFWWEFARAIEAAHGIKENT